MFIPHLCPGVLTEAVCDLDYSPWVEIIRDLFNLHLSSRVTVTSAAGRGWLCSENKTGLRGECEGSRRSRASKCECVCFIGEKGMKEGICTKKSGRINESNSNRKIT